MKTKKQISDEAKQLADALTHESFGLVGRTLRQLALLIHDLASVAAIESAKTAPRPPASRRKK
jgi:hypothetical protein